MKLQYNEYATKAMIKNHYDVNDRLIETYLTPDKEIKDPWSKDSIKLYSVDTIEKGFSGEVFEEDQQKYLERSRRMKKVSKEKEIQKLTDENLLKVTIGNLDLRVIYSTVVSLYNHYDYNDGTEETIESIDKCLLHRLAINYIRRELLQYDMLKYFEMSNKYGKTQTDRQLITKTMDSIAHTYPELEDEAMKQKEQQLESIPKK